MKSTSKYIIILILSLGLFASCESEVEKKHRQAVEERERLEVEALRKQEAEELAFQEEQDRLEREERLEAERIETEERLEIERQEKAIYDRHINNSLRTGSTPYAYCFGKNRSCSNNGCSEIKVTTPSNSDVMVTIKKNGKVYRHAYIKAGSSYSFEFPDGTYQTFFYYGKGWNPKKVMKQTSCGPLKGGFIENEDFGKDSPQTLKGNILEYKLILQQNGNFSTKPSSSSEAF